MKILRAVSRRGFNVGTAGWFTILRPNPWYPASRNQGTFKSPASGSSGEASGPRVLADGDRAAEPVRWLPSDQSTADRNGVRLASAIFGGLAITATMLWWIMHP